MINFHYQKEFEEMRATINLKKISIDFVNEWKQLLGGYNWIIIHPLMFRFEKDKMFGGMEVELYILGFGLRVYWTWNKKMSESKLKEYNRIVDEVYYKG